jgi:hypothetical protein
MENHNVSNIGRIPFADLFDGRLQQHGVYERVVSKKTTGTFRSLTDGLNSIWVNGDPDGDVHNLIWKGSNDPRRFTSVLWKEFGVRFIPKGDPSWNETEEERYQARIMEEQRDFFHEVRRHLKGLPNKIETEADACCEQSDLLTTVGLLKAELAAQCVREDLTLLQPENERELIDKVLTRTEELRLAFEAEAGKDQDPCPLSRRLEEEDLEDPGSLTAIFSRSTNAVSSSPGSGPISTSKGRLPF